jgi:hypothetical protein
MIQGIIGSYTIREKRIEKLQVSRRGEKEISSKINQLKPSEEDKSSTSSQAVSMVLVAERVRQAWPSAVLLLISSRFLRRMLGPFSFLVVDR